MNIPKTITCSLCGQRFDVQPFTNHVGCADTTVCHMKRADGTECGRIFQNAIGDDPTDVILRVHPDDIRDIWQASMGL